MPSKTDAQTIESFHLLFLQVLTASRQDWFVLKGGANIRYFFGSNRYSNDIDLDIVEREAWSAKRSTRFSTERLLPPSCGAPA
jgi:predicted nucleotidyltransferase component of viral defense system